MIKTPIQLDDYDYFLPEELIAQEPSEKREMSRLLVFQKNTNTIRHFSFNQILDILPENALIIANNSKVVPARILGQRKQIPASATKNTILNHNEIDKSAQGGARVEMLIMTPVPLLEKEAQNSNASVSTTLHTTPSTDNIKQECEIKSTKKTAVAQVLLKGSKRIKVGEELDFHSLRVKILEKQDFGKHIVSITWENSLVEELEKYGSLPLPPYIKRPDGLSSHDKKRYQTVYANHDHAGSVAAPTAGLHFTKELQEKLIAKGFLWEEVTLHVGYGTFSPVRAEDIREHEMHAEYVEIPAKTAKAILDARATNRPIITIGTTATRSLEGMAEAYDIYKKSSSHVKNEPNKNAHSPEFVIHNEDQTNHTNNTDILPVSGCSGYTNIFIYPGKEFRIINGLLTNFHLPKSSLLMLVSAFAGFKNTKEIYAQAISEKYRFFSYGDAMLILP